MICSQSCRLQSIMHVRSRQKNGPSLQFRPLLTIFLLSIPIVFIFFSSIFVRTDDLPKTNSEMVFHKTHGSAAMTLPKLSAIDTPKVIYDRVLEHSDTTLFRYEAFIELAGSKEPLSIRRWAELMTHNDTVYAASLARDLSVIVKVCIGRRC